MGREREGLNAGRWTEGLGPSHRGDALLSKHFESAEPLRITGTRRLCANIRMTFFAPL